MKKSPMKPSAERVVKDIRRQARRHFSAEDNIRIVLDGLRGEDSIAELCRKEGIAQNLNNVTPADAYFSRAPAIIKQHERIKRQAIVCRRLQHRKLAA
jgi:hypothetical protein